ncbi:MAG: hypothetical protein ACKOA8_10195, partial [Deltaproteobacteria bacterium]
YGEAIIRTSYMSTHTDQELDYVLETFARLGRELGVFEEAAYTGGTKKNGYDFSSDNAEIIKNLRKSSGDAASEAAAASTSIPR